MFAKLLAVFIGIPFIEILILIKLGEMMGFLNTVLLVIGTGFLGAVAARIEGMRAWQAIQKELQAGQMPGMQMIDGLLIFIAGLLLITPGLLTDITGFLILIPWSRAALKEWVRRKLEQMLRSGGSGQAGFFIRGN